MAKSLSERLLEVSEQIANNDVGLDPENVSVSIAHCNLQIRYFRLSQAIETQNGEPDRAAKASVHAELWEKRRNNFLSVVKLDTYKELLTRMDDMQRQAATLSGLDEVQAAPPSDDDIDLDSIH